MDRSNIASARGKLVISTTQSNSERAVSVTDRMVRISRPIALQPDEQAFIEKTLHYISGIRGAIANNLVLSTNTKFPTRYIIMVQGLPLMSMDDFEHILLMNDNIRAISLDMANETAKIDVWRAGNSSKHRRKRRRHKEIITSAYDLSSVVKRDRKCLAQLLVRMNALDEVECQFDLSIDTSAPDTYRLDMKIFDHVTINSLKKVLHECRSFCNTFDMDFPHKVIRAKCLRLAAPLRRRRLTLKN